MVGRANFQKKLKNIIIFLTLMKISKKQAMSSKKKETLINIDQAIANKNPKLKKMLPGFVVNYIKKIVHQDELNANIAALGEYSGLDFLYKGLASWGITFDSVGAYNFSPKGRYLFAANHPVGSIDGLALIGELGKYFGETKAVVNDLLLNVKHFEPLFLGVNKHGGNAKEIIKQFDEILESDKQVVMFPAGLASRRKKGLVRDAEWKKTFVSRAVKHRRDIVPVHISGNLSNWFYNLHRFRAFFRIKANLEMFYLVDEMFKQKNKHFRITFGKPIPYSQLGKPKQHKQIAEKLRQFVYQLEKNPDLAFKI